jgi:asparagine synthase (glutamine-hydrolysing)
MCGITGFATLDPTIVGERDLDAMSQAIAHRGPDDYGVHLEPGVGLAQRRLAILDLSPAGHQPMQGPGDTWITCNGEVYNFQEIAGELRQHGIHTRTRNDTEVMLLAIDRWGMEEALRRFNGMFAFAHWNPTRRTLSLVRDRLGVKPLYYYADSRCIVFASELRGLQQWSGCPTDLDLEAVDLYISYEHVPAPLTVLRGVRKLEPGTILEWHEGRITTRRWWDLAYDESPQQSDEAWIDEVEAALLRATRLRLISDVPLGALLSGGVDSSAVVAMMARLGHTPKTFSVGFNDDTYNELGHARAVARHVGAEHHEEILQADPHGALDILDLAMDEPLADVSLLPTHLVSRMARRDVTVALSGDGGDEVFAGYDWYRAAELADVYRRVPGAVRWSVDRLLQRVPPRAKKRGAVNTLKRFSEGASGDPRLEHLRWQIFADSREKLDLYSDGLRAHAGRRAAELFGIDVLSRARATTALSRRQWTDVRLYLPDDILAKVDRASMAVALEARSPFLDVDVVELAARLPDHLRMRGAARKVALKRAVAQYLPPGITDRRKEGFSIPMKQWLRSELQPVMRDTLQSPRAAELFDAARCRTLMDEHVQGTRNHAHLLWTLMVFELWRSRTSTTAVDTATRPIVLMATPAAATGGTT